MDVDEGVEVETCAAARGVEAAGEDGSAVTEGEEVVDEVPAVVVMREGGRRFSTDKDITPLWTADMMEAAAAMTVEVEGTALADVLVAPPVEVTDVGISPAWAKLPRN